MSSQKIRQISVILTNTTPFTLETDTPGEPVPADISKLILANTSATAVQVTLSDGVNNYYYAVPPGETVLDHDIPSDGGDIALNLPASTKWTVTLAANVTSLCVTAIFS